MALTLRRNKGTPLTHAEMDDNLQGLADGTNWSGTLAASVASLTVSTGNLTVSAGQVLAADGNSTAPGLAFGNSTNLGFFRINSTTFDVSLGGNPGLRFAYSSGGVIQWGIAGTFTAGLFIDAANTLAQRNGTSAQALRIYNTFTDASNYERLALSWAGNVVNLVAEQAGTGTSREMQIGTTGASSISIRTNNTNRWFFENTTGHFKANADNTYDIGASGATRPRTIYAGTSLSVIGTVSGTGVVAVGNGTAPTAQTDTVGFYSSDNSAGNTIPSFFCEGTEVIATGQADSASSVRVKMRINGTVVTLLAI